MLQGEPAANVRLAQLDRAFGYGPKGRGFESSNARYSRSIDADSVFGGKTFKTGVPAIFLWTGMVRFAFSKNQFCWPGRCFAGKGGTGYEESIADHCGDGVNAHLVVLPGGIGDWLAVGHGVDFVCKGENK